MGADKAASMTFDYAVGRYWMEVGQHSKERDLEANLARIIRMVGKDTLLSEIDDDRLSRLVAIRRAEFRRDTPKYGLVTPSTVNRSVTQLLRRIMVRARKAWKIPLPAEPEWGQHLLKEPVARIREMTFDEEAAIEGGERDDYRPARLFAQATGLRRREVVSLTWGQVDWGSGIIRVVQKGDQPHVLPITPEITGILWPLQGDHETAVFTYIAQRTRTCPKSGRSFVKGKRYPITYEGFGTAFSRAMAKSNVTDFRIHDLRHTGATRTLRASKDLKAVQEMLGHTDIKTTMRYAHAMKDDVAEAMNARQTDEAARRADHDRRTKSRKSPGLLAKDAGK